MLGTTQKWTPRFLQAGQGPWVAKCRERGSLDLLPDGTNRWESILPLSRDPDTCFARTCVQVTQGST
jgi:hypothetical protein